MSPFLLLSVLLLSFAPTLSADKSSDQWDFLILSLFWPGSKCIAASQCQAPSSANTWTIHGLWPTKKTGKGPAFCNKSMSFNFKDIKSISDKLLTDWPSYYTIKPTVSLWRHEWEKHGTCAISSSITDESEYFQKTLDLYNNVVTQLKKASIKPDDEKVYSAEEIAKSFEKPLGKKINLICKEVDSKSYLSELRVCFDKMLKMIDCDRNKCLGNANIHYLPGSSCRIKLDASLMGIVIGFLLGFYKFFKKA